MKFRLFKMEITLSLKHLLLLASLPDVFAWSPFRKNFDLLESNVPDVLLYIFSSLAFTALVNMFCSRFRLYCQHHLIAFFYGLIIGLVVRYSEDFQDNFSIVNLSPHHLAFFILPLLIFRATFCIDAHTFSKCWLQIMILSFVGSLLQITGISALAFIVLNIKGATIYDPIYFAVLMIPIYSLDVMSFLKDLGHQNNHIVGLLEGETLFSLTAAVLLLKVIFDLVVQKTIEQLIVEMFLYISVGVASGVVSGICSTMIIKKLYPFPRNTVIWILCFPYLVYFVTRELLGSPELAVSITVVFIAAERPGMAPEVDTFLISFWDFISQFAHAVLLFLIGCNVTATVAESDYHVWVMAPITYVVISVCRVIALIFLYPFLIISGPSVSIRKLLVLHWGGLKSVASVILIWQAVYDRHLKDHKINAQLYRAVTMHVIGVYVLSIMINGGTFHGFLSVLGLAQLSSTRLSNMTNCVNIINKKREVTMEVLKTDKFLADCNWPLIYATTVLKNPYQFQEQYTGDEEDYFMYSFGRIAICPDCDKEILEEPTSQEYKDMLREAKLRILKTKKSCYMRQYEQGMISRNGQKILSVAVEAAAEREDPTVEFDGLLKLFRRKSLNEYIMIWLTKLIKDVPRVRKPNTYLRRICYHLIYHRWYELVMCIVVLLNMIPIGLQLARHDADHFEIYALFSVNTVFCLVYIFEFIVKILGNSSRSIRDGFNAHFKKWFEIYDFLILIVTLFHWGMELVALKSDYIRTKYQIIYDVCNIIKLLRFARILKMLKVFKLLFHNFTKLCELMTDRRKAYAYELGKCIVKGEEEVLALLPQMADDQAIRDEIKQRIEKDRLEIVYELGLIQKERPWITITVKTKQAIRMVINQMKEAVFELKNAGWIDEFEYSKLNDTIKEAQKKVAQIKKVNPSEPRVIFNEIMWMGQNQNVKNYLFENVKTVTINTNEFACKENELTEGIFIIVTGLMKITYQPKKATLNLLRQRGLLPIVDYIISYDLFQERIEDYLVSGNSLGELSVLTNRPSNCNVKADTPTHCYLLPRDIIEHAMELDNDLVYGLESRLWKAVSLTLATAILSDIPIYKTLPRDRILMSLERAFMPNLKSMTEFYVTEKIEDIVLIEGVVKDVFSNNLYKAPCYIPRTVQRMILQHEIQSNSYLQTQDVLTFVRLLIIPVKDATPMDVFDAVKHAAEKKKTESKNKLHREIEKDYIVHTATDRIPRKTRKHQLTEDKELLSSSTFLYPRGSSFASSESRSQFLALTASMRLRLDLEASQQFTSILNVRGLSETRQMAEEHEESIREEERGKVNERENKLMGHNKIRSDMLELEYRRRKK